MRCRRGLAKQMAALIYHAAEGQHFRTVKQRKNRLKPGDVCIRA